MPNSRRHSSRAPPGWTGDGGGGDAGEGPQSSHGPSADVPSKRGGRTRGEGRSSSARQRPSGGQERGGVAGRPYLRAADAQAYEGSAEGPSGGDAVDPSAYAMHPYTGPANFPPPPPQQGYGPGGGDVEAEDYDGHMFADYRGPVDGERAERLQRRQLQQKQYDEIPMPPDGADPQTVFAYYRKLIGLVHFVPPRHWREIRFDLPANVAELRLYPQRRERVQDREPIRPASCVVVCLDGTLPEDTTPSEYAAQMVQYMFDLLQYQKASTAITELRFVKKGTELSQMVVTLGKDTRLAGRVLTELQAAGLRAYYGKPVFEFPPNATFQVVDYRRTLHDGHGISADDVAFLLEPVRQYNTVDINVIEGYEPGVFYAPVKRPETVYSFLWNYFCSYKFQQDLFRRFGVLVTMASCPHEFLQKGVPYHIQKQQLEEKIRAELLQKSMRKDDGDGSDDDDDDADDDAKALNRGVDSAPGEEGPPPAWAINATEEIDIFSPLAPIPSSGAAPASTSFTTPATPVGRAAKMATATAAAAARANTVATTITFVDDDGMDDVDALLKQYNAVTEATTAAVKTKSHAPVDAAGLSGRKDGKGAAAVEENGAPPPKGLDPSSQPPLPLEAPPYASGDAPGWDNGPRRFEESYRSAAAAGYVPQEQRGAPYGYPHPLPYGNRYSGYGDGIPTHRASPYPASAQSRAPYQTPSYGYGEEAPSRGGEAPVTAPAPSAYPPLVDEREELGESEMPPHASLQPSGPLSREAAGSGVAVGRSPQPPQQQPYVPASSRAPPEREALLSWSMDEGPTSGFTTAHAPPPGPPLPMQYAIVDAEGGAVRMAEPESRWSAPPPGDAVMMGESGGGVLGDFDPAAMPYYAGSEGGMNLMSMQAPSPFVGVWGPPGGEGGMPSPYEGETMPPYGMGPPMGYYGYGGEASPEQQQQTAFSLSQHPPMFDPFQPMEGGWAPEGFPQGYPQPPGVQEEPAQPPVPMPPHVREAAEIAGDVEERVQTAFPASWAAAAAPEAPLFLLDGEWGEDTLETDVGAETAPPVLEFIPVEAAAAVTELPAPTTEIAELLSFLERNVAAVGRLLHKTSTTTVEQACEVAPFRARVARALLIGVTTTAMAMDSQPSSGMAVTRDLPAAVAAAWTLQRAAGAMDARPDAAAITNDDNGSHDGGDAEAEQQLPALLPYLLRTPAGADLALLLAFHFPRSFTRRFLPYAPAYIFYEQTVHIVLTTALRRDTRASNLLVQHVAAHWCPLMQWLRHVAYHKASTAIAADASREEKSPTASTTTTTMIMKQLVSVIGNTMDTVFSVLSPGQREACRMKSDVMRYVAAFAEAMQAPSDGPAHAEGGAGEGGALPQLWGPDGALYRSVVRLCLNADVCDGAQIAAHMFSRMRTPDGDAAPTTEICVTKDHLYFCIVLLSRSHTAPVLSCETAAFCGAFLKYLELQLAQQRDSVNSDDADGGRKAGSVSLGEKEAAQLLDTAFKVMRTVDAYTALRNAYLTHNGPITRCEGILARLSSEAPPESLQLRVSTLREWYEGGGGLTPTAANAQPRQKRGVEPAAIPAIFYYQPSSRRNTRWGQLPQPKLSAGSTVNAARGGGAAAAGGGTSPGASSIAVRWRSDWTAAMRAYPPSGLPFDSLPEGWTCELDRGTGRYRFRGPAGEAATASLTHPVEGRAFLVTPQAFLQEATAAADCNDGGAAMREQVRLKANRFHSEEAATSGLPPPAELTSADVEAWAADQRRRHAFLDVAAMEVLGLTYHAVVRTGAAAAAASSSSPVAGVKRNREVATASAVTPEELQQRLREVIPDSYPATGAPYPSLTRGWSVFLNSARGQYAFSGPSSGSRQPPLFVHPKTRKTYFISPQAFVQQRRVNVAVVARVAQVEQKEVEVWLMDQRTRHPAIDAAVVKLIPITYGDAAAVMEANATAVEVSEAGVPFSGPPPSSRERESQHRSPPPPSSASSPARHRSERDARGGGSGSGRRRHENSDGEDSHSEEEEDRDSRDGRRGRDRRRRERSPRRRGGGGHHRR